MLLLVEDLQWCDPSSLELLGRLIEQSPTARVLLVCTVRPDFKAPWAARSNLTPLQLSRLTNRQTREMLAALSPERALPESVVDLVVMRADGVPLYVEELGRMILESELLVERAGRWELGAPITELAIPATLHDSLIARLDRLSAAKEVAQRAAVLGRDFSYALLVRAAGLNESTLRQGLARLVQVELLFQRGEPPAATYTFKHALIQEAAYRALLKRTHRDLHARAAQVLEEEFPAHAASAPEVVARHTEAAGLIDQAVDQYQRAGEQAAARSADEEAISHLRRGIALLADLPEGEGRDARESSLQIRLGNSLAAVRGNGHAETGAAFERARLLSGAPRDTGRRAAALAGLSAFHTVKGDPQQGTELARVLLALARETGDTEHFLVAHAVIAHGEYYQGKFASSLAHVEEAIALYDRSNHPGIGPRYAGVDLRVSTRCYASVALWYLGYPDRALGRVREAVGLARVLEHPYSLSMTLLFEAAVRCQRRESAEQRKPAEQAIALSEAQDFPVLLGVAKVWHGEARASADGDATGVAEVSEGLALAQKAVGQLAEAMAMVEAALAIAAQAGLPYSDAALYCGKGELLLSMQDGDAREAEALFRRALEIARAQEARSLELRAAMHLARLLYAQGKSDEARALLAPIYAWFTEGFDTGDLVEAKAQLDELT